MVCYNGGLMKQDYTHIVMVIDRSGSMSDTWNDVRGGYKQIVQDNKKEPGQCTFTVAVFDDKYDVLEDFTDISKVSEDLATSPRGWTALLDAVGKTIIDVGEKLNNLKEDEKPSKILVMIQTDGLENSSKEFNREQIKKMIEEQTSKYNWNFMFLGASLDAVNDAVSWGINLNSASTYSTAKTGSTFSLVGEKLKGYRSATTESDIKCMSGFTAEDREILN